MVSRISTAALLVLLTLLIVACSGTAAPTTLPTLIPLPTETSTSTVASPTPSLVTFPSAKPTPAYTPYPDPPGTFADCQPYAAGAQPTPTPAPSETPGPTVDPDALVPCGREEWRIALQPVIEAVNKDHKNYCEAYFPVSEFDAGDWRLVINFVKDGDPDARARVKALIQPHAPVDWRNVKYSCADLSKLQDHDIPKLIGADSLNQVNSIAVDVIANAVSVETHGEQPDLAAKLTDKFGDAVVIVVGPTEPPPPI